MTVKPKLNVTLRMSAESENHSRTMLKTRNLMDISDEPEERGGTNEGFTPTDFLLGGLAACTNVISHKVAHKHGIEIQELYIDIAAKFDRRGVTIEEHVAVPFPEIKMDVRVITTAGQERIDFLGHETAKFCAVSNVIRQSGTKMIETWTAEAP